MSNFFNTVNALWQIILIKIYPIFCELKYIQIFKDIYIYSTLFWWMNNLFNLGFLRIFVAIFEYIQVLVGVLVKASLELQSFVGDSKLLWVLKQPPAPPSLFEWALLSKNPPNVRQHRGIVNHKPFAEWHCHQVQNRYAQYFEAILEKEGERSKGFDKPLWQKKQAFW